MAERAMLFDLDGTLLALDTEAFVHRYMKRLGEYTAHIVDPELLVKSVWQATKYMMTDDRAERTNEEIFRDHFLSLCGLEQEAIWPVFDKFYAEEFPRLKEDIEPHPYALQVVEEAKKQGYKLVVATNPIFPDVAIRERMKWAGLKENDFIHVTVFESSHYCKPNPKYFLEICERIGIKPKYAIMVGNDMQQDMVAAEVGLKTFLVEDYKIDRGVPQYRVDASGTLQELYDQLISRNGIFSE
ncbi:MULTISPECIES: HAD family hydrolase [Aneurinibacillus]|uniref:HAD family hydrolase n=1 Tax=Aneurinibacillus thermoaerophilus TaxID=143495 RepID=A0A1G7WNI3_ANETH|nr:MULTISPECIES: HAD family hydrolase [Aneurinibacillus]AMA74043.1 haloacid dehalogenase [Aneurinibacillus sp. XH2]MED0675846.1 HAD family hydrolase [Aneurinibacillus thermoaerophilus]MED0678194.1 HAD family hydrolase [Aneurinibacillus thermoaerophilus]MED0737911.1 HAD family hydrolase [Aneurinibacillus thermoaerophilus]MED0755610.1 HAD family hydrolase [Aneurinibacillus thermoaerophilus]